MCGMCADEPAKSEECPDFAELKNAQACVYRECPAKAERVRNGVVKKCAGKDVLKEREKSCKSMIKKCIGKVEHMESKKCIYKHMLIEPA